MIVITRKYISAAAAEDPIPIIDFVTNYQGPAELIMLVCSCSF
jgi:hypothetical protein